MEHQHERVVRELLEEAGLTVSRIPRGATPTADYRAFDGTHVYFVEATHRSPADYANLLERARRDGVGHLSRPVAANNTLDGIVREKAKQLAATPEDSDFQVAWLTADAGDSAHIVETLFTTLYGVRRLAGSRGASYDAEVGMYNCFYYDYFTFFDTPALDAVAYSSPEHVALLVNPFANNVELFRNCMLVSEFRRRGGLVDPREFESQPVTLFLDHDVDRAAKRARWESLRDKYGLHISEGMRSTLTGIISVPVEPPEQALQPDAPDGAHNGSE